MHLLPYTLLFIRSMIAAHQLVKRPSATEELPFEYPTIAWGAELDKCLHSAFSFIQHCHDQADEERISTQIPFFPANLVTQLLKETEGFPSTIKASATLLRGNGCFVSGLYPWIEANSDTPMLRYVCSALDFTNVSQTTEIRELAKRYSTEKANGDYASMEAALQALCEAMNHKTKFLYWETSPPDEIDKTTEQDLIDQLGVDPGALSSALAEIRANRAISIKSSIKRHESALPAHPNKENTPPPQTLDDIEQGMTLSLF